MKLRSVVSALVSNGCRILREGGKHTLWLCPCIAQHNAAVPRHREITAGVVGSIIKQLPCLPKGWLQ